MSVEIIDLWVVTTSDRRWDYGDQFYQWREAAHLVEEFNREGAQGEHDGIVNWVSLPLKESLEICWAMRDKIGKAKK